MSAEVSSPNEESTRAFFTSALMRFFGGEGDVTDEARPAGVRPAKDYPTTPGKDV